ncbi:FAD-dependent oxidoreductase [Ruegeria sp. Alg231-54]|uniref:FAD-dependent oxidoreductase n=1 Tax=Ruegeria sp. Alg231-54 TaxID=1922221 RepID=UPI001F3E1A3F|nr:NAD(P)/FAD-dependent oxidoreductase [Ruegeria sp. Alg231-54]
MLIVGAGLSGLIIAIEVRKRGIKDIAVLEKANEIGGTWRENTYLDVACDIPSHFYSMATHLNPDWSRADAGGAEIQAYLKQVCFDEGNYDLCPFGQQLKSARWDGSRWQVETESVQRWSARFLFSVIGALHTPSISDIPGADSFPGPCFHSAE